MFCLFYDAKTKKVSAMNGSGRSSASVTLEKIRKDLDIADGENGQIPMDSVYAATVPGAAAGWVDCVERFGSGKVSMDDILAPAIDLAENGFPESLHSHNQSVAKRISGRKARKTSEKHLQMVMRCSRNVQQPKTAAEHPKRERS
jgi:gamma-glutamyltranspeptidase/glutathione hydrolase